MRTVTLSLLLTVAPALAAAQSSAAEPGPMQGFSAEGRLQAAGTLQAARDEGLPTQPLIAVMLEGQAKGATEAQILGAEQQAFAQLAAAQDAIVAAGRTDPTDAELSLAASLMAQGATEAQVGALVARTPADVSLVSAFGTSATLTAEAIPTGTARAEVGTTGGAAGSSVDAGGAGSVGSLSAAGSLTAGASGGLPIPKK
jgi:hypothetical protein